MALIENGRISFHALARRLNLSVTSVKKRYDRLLENKVILRFTIYPSLAMLDAEYFWAFLTTTDSTTNEALLNRLGACPMIDIITILADGDLLCWGMYKGSKGLDELTNFLHEQPEISEVEFHTLVVQRGQKCELKPEDVHVLACLRHDLRMQIKEISQRSGFSPRRVRRILDKLLLREGSTSEFWVKAKGVGDRLSNLACFHARIDSDVAATGYTRFLVRIGYQGGSDARWALVEWLQQRYPLEIWYTFASASEPVIFTLFLLEYMSQTPELIRAVRAAPGVVSVKQIIHYQHRFYPGLNEAFWDTLQLPE